MRHSEHPLSEILMCWIALAIALAIAFSPQNAAGGAYDSEAVYGKAPRWSNDHQLADTVIAGPDCVSPSPSQQAEYLAGRDAYGYPVAPADNYTGYRNTAGPKVELEVQLDQKMPGGKAVDITSGTIPYTVGSAQGGYYPPQRHCAPYFK